MATEVEELREQLPSAKLGVTTRGWASPKTLHVMPLPGDLKPIVSGVLERMYEYTGHATPIKTQCWLHVLDPGGETHLHDHNQATLSCIYYPDDHPIPLLVRATEEYPIAAKRDWLVVFDAMVQHRVPLNTTDTPRLCVAFNFFYHTK